MILKLASKILKFLTSRIFFILIAFLFQLGLYLGIFFMFRDSTVYFLIFEMILRILVVLYIINDSSEPSFKIAWLIAIVFLPYLGSVIYFLISWGNSKSRIKRRLDMLSKKAEGYLKGCGCEDKLRQESSGIGGICRYAGKWGGFPVYESRDVKYYPLGENYFEDMLTELKKAEKFIFIEYFIIQEGKMWNSILEILKEKVKQGVEVKVIYDDLGCFFTLPRGYRRTLESLGIECRIFNPIRMVLNIIYNNRNHRKICVIDGKTAFTGGINLADEYINEVVRFGHWKDTGIRFGGESVWNYTVAFLMMWELCSRGKAELDYNAYKTECEEGEKSGGYILPFTDSPFDKEVLAQNMYLDIIERSTDYVYITTPYLILEEKMINSLVMAAKRGVDVRIMTPHIPDKKAVFMVTRSNYKRLIKGGVRIFEYTPGFLHAKSIVSDDDKAIVGSINLDYRSLYLHCECGVYMYRVPVTEDIKRDHIEIMKVSEEIRDTKVHFPVGIIRSVLNVFAPLM